MTETQIMSIPSDVIREHILSKLIGFDLLNFTSTCKKYRSLLTYVQMIKMAFTANDVVIAQKKTIKRKLCECGEWVLNIQTHVREVHRLPKTMICYCYDTFQNHVGYGCPLAIVKCYKCDTSGRAIDIIPWNVLLIGKSKETNIVEYRSAHDSNYGGPLFCINCINDESYSRLLVSKYIIDLIKIKAPNELSVTLGQHCTPKHPHYIACIEYTVKSNFYASGYITLICKGTSNISVTHAWYAAYANISPIDKRSILEKYGVYG